LLAPVDNRHGEPVFPRVCDQLSDSLRLPRDHTGLLGRLALLRVAGGLPGPANLGRAGAAPPDLLHSLEPGAAYLDDRHPQQIAAARRRSCTADRGALILRRVLHGARLRSPRQHLAQGHENPAELERAGGG
jgi:hypothetical protein